MPPAVGGFVHPDPSQSRKVLGGQEAVHVPADDPPESGVRLPQDAGDLLHGKKGGQFHHEGFEEQGEAASFLPPGDGDLVDSMFRTLRSGDPGMKVGLVLEEVQVAPGALQAVMNRMGTPALRAGESGALPEGDVQVHPSLQGIPFDGLDEPGLFQAQKTQEELVQVRHFLAAALSRLAHESVLL